MTVHRHLFKRNSYEKEMVQLVFFSTRIKCEDKRKYFLFCVLFLTVEVKYKSTTWKNDLQISWLKLILTLLSLVIKQVRVLTNICLFKFNKRNTRNCCETCPKLTLKTTAFISLLLSYFALFSSVSIVDFE